MKTFATKDLRSRSSSQVKNRSVHRPAGARARTQQLAVRRIVQPRVKIGQPDDHFEREADRVADRVVANQAVTDISSVSGHFSGLVSLPVQSEPGHDATEAEEDIQRQPEEEEAPLQTKSVQRQPEEEEEPLQAKLVQRQPEEEEEPLQTKLVQRQPEDEEEPLQTKLVQRQPEEEEEPLQTKLVQRQPEEEEEPLQTKLVQRQPEEEEEPLQTKLVQRQPEEEEEPLQTKLVQRQPEEEPVQAKTSTPGIHAADSALRDGAPGSPLRPDVRAALEFGIGTDLSSVRVHEGSKAHEAAASINARAFTHRNDIWLGAGQSQSDLHLMAHEATHVVQQRGGLRANSAPIGSGTPRVQRLWNPVAAISNAVSNAVEWVGDTIGEAVDYIKEQAAEFVQAMPGYSLFTVVNGSDPITGRRVERNGRNFIEAGLDIIPNGAALKQKLEQEGALEEAASWLDGQIMELDFSPTAIAAQFANFWSSLSISDVSRLPTVMRRLANIILEPLARIRRFAVNVASRLLQIVKNYVVSALVNFIRERTSAYPLLTVILGRDPILNEVVERTPVALLRGFLQLSESGQEQLRQMEESGSLQRAADWLDRAVTRLNITWEVIRESFSAAWDLVTIQNLLDPLGTFRELYTIFAGPVGRILNFLVEIASMVLRFIKDALVRRLVAYARTVRGYPLIAVILGRDPFSQEPVERSTANIIRGFMSLMENGEQQFREMEQSGAIARMSERVEGALAMLNFTWEYIRGLFTRAWNSFSLQDLAAPFEAFARMMAIFAGPILRLVNFVGQIIRVAIEVIMEVMNFPIDLIRNIISRAMQAIDDIKRDPIGFLKNLLRAVKTGFQQFFGNILRHLIGGLTGWLFSELRDANINPPADLGFRSILSFVLEVLGITVERIWQKLVERVGEERVARIRGMINRLTGIWTFVRDVATRGPVAIWEYIQERLSNLWQTVLGAVRNWVVTRIIERITVRLLSMLDPTGIMAVINGFIAFYNAVQSFIRYLREMLEIVNSFVVGVAEIARGNLTIAANFLEGSLARAMPVAIGFLANQVGLSGIGRRIGEMIERVRDMVDRALTWLVDRAVSAGGALLNLGRSAVAAVRDWWNTRERVRTRDGRNHELTFTGTGASASLTIRSTPTPYDTYLDRLKAEHGLTEDQVSAARAKARQIDTEKRRTVPDNQREQQGATIHSLVVELANLTRQLPLTSATTSLPPVYGPLNNGFGSSATVGRLTHEHETGGRPTVSSTRWRTLLRRKEGTVTNPGGRSHFVAGHLLNDNLGGPGNTWRNLTPLTQTANNSGSDSHLHGFETPVKTAVNTQHRTADFTVTAQYGRAVDAGLSHYFRMQGTDDDNTRADIVEAEQFVPRSLHCNSYELDASGSRGRAIAQHTVSNSFLQTPDSYPLTTGARKVPVYLMQMTKAELMGLDGVDEALADRIIAAKPFRTTSQLQSSAGIGSGKWAQIQATAGKTVRLYRRG